MHVYVQKSTATTLPRRPSVVSGGEFSHPLAPSRDGMLPPSTRRPGAQPGPRTDSRMASSSDDFWSMTAPWIGSAQRPERGPQLGGEQLGLLPRGEVTAPVHLVEVAEGGVGQLGPAPRGAPDLAGE